MQSNWWLSLTFYCEMLALAVALCVLLRKRMAPRFPFLFSALALELMVDIALACLMRRPGHYAAYFYIYWISSGVQAILRLWIVSDIIHSFEGIGFLPRSLHLFIGVAGATMALASALYCLRGQSNLARDIISLSGSNLFHLSPALAKVLVQTVILLNRCVRVAWFVFFVVSVLASIKMLQLGWSADGAYVATAIFLRILVEYLVADKLVHSPAHTRLLANGFDSICTIAILLSLSYQFMQNPPTNSPESVGSNATEYSLQMLLKLLPSRER